MSRGMNDLIVDSVRVVFKTFTAAYYDDADGSRVSI